MWDYEAVTCELCFWVHGDLPECENCLRYFCEDCAAKNNKNICSSCEIKGVVSNETSIV